MNYSNWVKIEKNARECGSKNVKTLRICITGRRFRVIGVHCNQPQNIERENQSGIDHKEECDEIIFITCFNGMPSMAKKC